MTLPLRMRLFRNKNHEKGDNKPPYSNSNFTVPETITLEAGKSYSCGLWKDENHDTLNLRLDEKKEMPSGGYGGNNTQLERDIVYKPIEKPQNGGTAVTKGTAPTTSLTKDDDDIIPF